MIPPLLFVCRTVSDAKNTEGQWRSVFLSWLVIYTYFSGVDATLCCALYQWSVIALEVIRVRRLILATLREISLAMPCTSNWRNLSRKLEQKVQFVLLALSRPCVLHALLRS